MKGTLLTLAIFAAAQFSLMANPACPGKIPYRQPDGSIIYVHLVGDEWLHYTLDDSGRCVTLGKDGFFHETSKPTFAQIEEARAQRNSAYRPSGAWTPRTDLTIGERHIPVILIEFQDREFLSSSVADDFSNLLNQRGYSYNGGTGSVRDYYEDNSNGLFKPIFDVFGPYKVSGSLDDYASKEQPTALSKAAFWEASKELSTKGVIDFSNYDANGDGAVDMILFYFAGFNQSEGRGTNTNTIWPHQGTLYSYAAARSTKLNGKYLRKYFCTSELRGYQGSTRCGIGTTCHEFGHSLGLPDFYDTDYEYNGESDAIYSYSLMCSGSRLNNENTPPHLNIVELSMLGWLGQEPEKISQNGTYTVQPVTSAHESYTLDTSTEGEYFLLESRRKTGWDAYIPGEGLLVYHVDKSSRALSYRVYSDNDNYYTVNVTAQTLWDSWESYNAINVIGSHPCFYLIPAARQESLSYSDETKIPFPGAASVRTYLPKDWEGEDNRFRLNNISFSGGVASFTVVGGAVPGVYGKVMNSSGQPIKSATVKISTSSPKQMISSSVTDIDGSFSFTLSGYEPGNYILDVTGSGYVAESITLELPRKSIEHNVYLLAEGETLTGDLQRYTGSGTAYYYGSGSSSGSVVPNQAISIIFSAEEMGFFSGKQLRSISFRATKSYGGVDQTGDFYVFVDIDGDRVFTQKVDNPTLGSMFTVDVSGHGLVIDNPNQTVIGYGVINNNLAYPFIVETCSSTDYGYFTGNFTLDSPCSWSAMASSSSNEYFTPFISAKLSDPVGPELGFHYINNPGNGVYSAGDRFEFELVRSSYDEAISNVSWYYDGYYSNSSSVSLTSGRHEIKAVLSLTGGGTNTLSLSIQVN